MKLDTKAIALAFGILWAGVVLLVSLVNLGWPGYGQVFLDCLASVYPGYVPGTGLASVFIGTAYGFVDGLIGGAVFAWLYNRLAS